MNLTLRTIPELLVMSGISSGTPNKYSNSIPYSSSTISTSNFKCVTLRFANYADMVEYSLRPITNSGIWRSIMAPTYSTMTLVIEWTIHIRYQFPLSRDILLVRGLIIGITLYLVQPRLWQVLFTRTVVCGLLWTYSYACKTLDDIPPRGPRVYLSVIGMDKSHCWSICLNSYFPDT